MGETDPLSSYINQIEQAINNRSFIRLIISNKRNKSQELRSVIIKPVVINDVYKLNFIFRNPTQDITKNHSGIEAIETINKLLTNEFYQAELFTTQNNWHLFINKKKVAKISKNPPTLNLPVSFSHDKEKNRLIPPNNNIYLRELGITTNEGRVKPSMQDKYKQINKYIELIKGFLPDNEDKALSVVDMGSGKGYLTFGTYDYLNNNKKIKASITGVEFRQNLVDHCNQIAKKCHFDNLHFVQGTIESAHFENPDVLIALHACDTATDEAIFRGIKAGAKSIICAPCCHKQIRKQLNPENQLNLISKYGILKERQAEILTDTIRSLILEAFGYKTKVFEFISTEHTPKNVMIAGILNGSQRDPDKSILNEIKKLKDLHGIQYHHLERLLNI